MAQRQQPPILRAYVYPHFAGGYQLTVYQLMETPLVELDPEIAEIMVSLLAYASGL